MNISVFVGLLVLALVMVLLAVVFALHRAIMRISDINEQLLLLAGMAQHGEGAARALIAKVRGPGRIDHIEAEKKPEQKPEGIVMRIGA